MSLENVIANIIKSHYSIIDHVKIVKEAERAITSSLEKHIQDNRIHLRDAQKIDQFSETKRGHEIEIKKAKMAIEDYKKELQGRLEPFGNKPIIYDDWNGVTWEIRIGDSGGAEVASAKEVI